MGKPAPDTETLKRLYARGLSYEEIAEELYRLTGYETNARNLGVYISRNRERLGLPLRRPRYDELIPWQIHPRHVAHYDLRMLRLQGRLDRGWSIDPEWAEKLEQWKRRLAELDGVVAYYWHDPQGFYWVPRRDGDGQFIRPPEGICRDVKEMAGAS